MYLLFISTRIEAPLLDDIFKRLEIINHLLLIHKESTGSNKGGGGNIFMIVLGNEGTTHHTQFVNITSDIIDIELKN